ncbi:MAG: transposase-like protein [Planctomycetota bacterium]|jgi:transposase-like protein
MRTAISRMACPSEACEVYGKSDSGSIALHGFSKVKRRRRRRYRCTACGKTFGATSGTAYERLQHSMRKFDRVATLSVEGVSKAAIARIEGLCWNTVSRWLELAAAYARQFNDANLRGYTLEELQLDELNTFLGNRNEKTWVFPGIEVSSRLWPATLVGARTWNNTKSFIRTIADSSEWAPFPLITSDGMKFYGNAIQLTFGVGCVHAQVIKKIKQNRVVKVGTKLVIGSEWRLEDALEASEDSTKMNTAFIERLNLTIRQGSAYLNRRSPCHARKKRTLDDHLELLRFHYNFCRPHSSLKFGKVVRTPAMQAGLVSRKLTLRDLFVAKVAPPCFVLVRFVRSAYHRSMEFGKCAA